MSDRTRIYLDNATTSWLEPPAVYQAVDDYQRRLPAAVGRGGCAEAEGVNKAIDETPVAVARLIGAESRERIIFTFNSTNSLKLAVHGTLSPSAYVNTSVAESRWHPAAGLANVRGGESASKSGSMFQTVQAVGQAIPRGRPIPTRRKQRLPRSKR